MASELKASDMSVIQGGQTTKWPSSFIFARHYVLDPKQKQPRRTCKIAGITVIFQALQLLSRVKSQRIEGKTCLSCLSLIYFVTFDLLWHWKVKDWFMNLERYPTRYFVNAVVKLETNPSVMRKSGLI